MSKEAQAERERRARVILGTAETEIAEKFEQASKNYTDNPVALHLRGMKDVYKRQRQPCAPDRYLQYPHLFFEEKALFG